MKDLIKTHRRLLLGTLALLLCLTAVSAVVLLRDRQLRQELEAEADRLEQEWAALELEAAQDLLSRSLLGSWTRSVEDDRNSRLELVITDGDIQYNFRNARFPEYDQTLFTYGWTPMDGQHLELRYPEGGSNLLRVTVTPAQGDTPAQVTFSPAITSPDASETWERSTP